MQTFVTVLGIFKRKIFVFVDLFCGLGTVCLLGYWKMVYGRDPIPTPSFPDSQSHSNTYQGGQEIRRQE